MRRECRERCPRHWRQRQLPVSDQGMHHGTCVTHVSWCMSGSLTRGVGENVPCIPCACATRNFTYLVRGPWIPMSYNRGVMQTDENMIPSFVVFNMRLAHIFLCLGLLINSEYCHIGKKIQKCLLANVKHEKQYIYSSQGWLATWVTVKRNFDLLL